MVEAQAAAARLAETGSESESSDDELWVVSKDPVTSPAAVLPDPEPESDPPPAAAPDLAPEPVPAPDLALADRVPETTGYQLSTVIKVAVAAAATGAAAARCRQATRVRSAVRAAERAIAAERAAIAAEREGWRRTYDTLNSIH